MNKKNNNIIIVRKKKRQRHDHHGGSWKIAYADFMTAMMAFFLVMWLISQSSPEQRHSIADYFHMPLRAALSQGNRSSLSESTIPGGGDNVVKQDGEVQQKVQRKIDHDKDKKSLNQAREDLLKIIETDPRLNNFKSNLRLSMTEEGLFIQIVDSQERPMFKVGSKELEPYMRDILNALVPVLNKLPNRINLSGHTDSLPYARGEVGYSNWELSTDRANASRRALIAGGMDNNKFLRVIGMANTMSIADSTPDSPINRRISILVLYREKEKSILRKDTLLQDLSAAEGGEKNNTDFSITDENGE